LLLLIFCAISSDIIYTYTPAIIAVTFELNSEVMQRRFGV